MLCFVCKKKLVLSKGNIRNKRIKYLYSEEHKRSFRVHEKCVPAILVMNRFILSERPTEPNRVKPIFYGKILERLADDLLKWR